MNLYLESGYLDMASIIESGYPFIFLPAARGTGKTYGALKYHITKGNKILLIRRTKQEAEIQARNDTTSYKTVFNDLGMEYTCTPMSTKTGYGAVSIVKHVDDYADQHINVAIVASLKTFASVRGIDLSDIDYIVYDECIAEPHVPKIKMEGMALAQLYETVNRNRELKGRRPVQLLCMSNSMNLANDVFIYFKLIEPAEKMLNNNIEFMELGNKLLIIPQNSPISKQKSKTALYQAVNNEFSEMAIKNKFILNDFTYVQRRNLAEYCCLFNVGDLFVYKHKARNEFYVTFSKSKTDEVYTNGYADLIRFKRERWRFAGYYFDGMIKFENFRAIALWEKYFDI